MQITLPLGSALPESDNIFQAFKVKTCVSVRSGDRGFGKSQLSKINGMNAVEKRRRNPQACAGEFVVLDDHPTLASRVLPRKRARSDST
jgi:hypothetical protein